MHCQFHLAACVNPIYRENIAVFFQVNLDIASIDCHQHIADEFGGDGVLQCYRHGKGFSSLYGFWFYNCFADVNHWLSGWRIYLRDNRFVDLTVGDGNVKCKGGFDWTAFVVKSGSIDSDRIGTVSSSLCEKNVKGNQVNILRLCAVFRNDTFQIEGFL